MFIHHSVCMTSISYCEVHCVKTCLHGIDGTEHTYMVSLAGELM